MLWFSVGLAVGISLTVPLAVFAVRRAEGRVRRLELQAAAAERLAELGTLTGGLAHEIKNPLSTIGLNAQLIEEDLVDLGSEQGDSGSGLGWDRLPGIRSRFEVMARETKRLRDILDDFLRYAGRVKLERADTNVNALIDELADFFEPQAATSDIRLRRQLAAEPATVMADASVLKQAILNLMINATQAMRTARAAGKDARHGGCDELIIRTESKRRDGRDWVFVHVTDTGPGLDTATAPRIFQPYFSTKSGGTGLGLPTARRIVEEHGGVIQVYGEPGRGCDFVISLPAEGGADELGAGE
jgi:signal transduction histidine kinase